MGNRYKQKLKAPNGSSISRNFTAGHKKIQKVKLTKVGFALR